jgi:glucose dehydrogenase
MTRILMGACALLFFVPGIQLTLFGSSLNLPYFLTHLLAWSILGGALFIHRSRRSVLAMEGT